MAVLHTFKSLLKAGKSTFTPRGRKRIVSNSYWLNWLNRRRAVEWQYVAICAHGWIKYLHPDLVQAFVENTNNYPMRVSNLQQEAYSDHLYHSAICVGKNIDKLFVCLWFRLETTVKINYYLNNCMGKSKIYYLWLLCKTDVCNCYSLIKLLNE